jgi:DNA primase
MTEVENILQENNVRYTPKGKDLLVNCLSPEHEDRNPSMRIDKNLGIGRCFSCGFSVNVFDFYGVQVDGRLARIDLLKAKIKEVIEESRGLELPAKVAPISEPFRDISVNTYRHFEAYEENGRICFPMRDTNGKIRAFNARAIDPNVELRYLITPPGAKVPLFPPKPQPEHSTIIIVEGIFDALRLWDYGFKNVIALSGVNRLHGKKGLNKEVVSIFKLSGVSRIYLMLDGDDAGRQATEDIKPLLEAENFFVMDAGLADGEDPCDLTKEQVSAYLANMASSSLIKRKDNE